MSNFNWVSPNDDNIAKRRVIKNQKKFFANYDEVIEEQTQEIAQANNIADLVIQQFDDMIILAEEINAFVITTPILREETFIRTVRLDDPTRSLSRPVRDTVMSSTDEYSIAPNFYQGIVGLLGRLTSGCTKLYNLLIEMKNYENYIPLNKGESIKNLYANFYENISPIKDIKGRIILFGLQKLADNYIEVLKDLMRDIYDSTLGIQDLIISSQIALR